MSIQFHLNLLTTIGLIADIIGVIFLFMYGLPSNIEIPGGYVLRKIGDDDVEAIEKENNKIKFRAKIGLTRLIVGFVFQFLGSNLILSF